MKLGDTISGYRIVSEPSNSGGGRCVWAFAERDGKQYFIKQFLDPKWPTDASMGSDASKKRRREECARFEARHRSVNARINPTALGGGNLVTAIDFFRDGTCYYKVTDRIAAESLGSLAGFTLRQTAVVLRTLCLSIRLLHRAGIVHGDLKPGNVLLQQSSTSDLYTAKVIDFDDAYPSGDPPSPDQVVGDQRFGAPEWLRYVKGDPAFPAKRLTIAADIFSLGLVIHSYLTGALPAFDHTRYGAPAEAVHAGGALTQSGRLSTQLRPFLTRMTSLDPTGRPTVDDVLKLMENDRVFAVGDDAPTTTTAAPGSRLRINVSSPGSDGTGTSRIRKNF